MPWWVPWVNIVLGLVVAFSGLASFHYQRKAQRLHREWHAMDAREIARLQRMNADLRMLLQLLEAWSKR